MPRKVFVSYKFSDGLQCKNRLMEKLGSQGYVYKGEMGFNDLSEDSDNTIKNFLADKIYDSTVTIVVISRKVASSKWVDWEIRYSLKHNNRGGRVSNRNGILCVVQRDPQILNSQWAFTRYSSNVNRNYLPEIIKQNMKRTYWNSPYEWNTYLDYCIVVTESAFMRDPQKYIEQAYERANDPQYKVFIN